MITPAERLLLTEEYYFSKKLKEVKQLKASGKPIINLGIGSPDIYPPKKVVDAMIDATGHHDAHRYQPYAGIPELRRAFQFFYKHHYDVTMNADKNVLPLMGSKEGIFHVSMAFVNPGDEILIPNPGYPTYEAVCKLVQAKPIFYSLIENNNWKPDLKDIEKKISSRTRLMWINYPNMPTGVNIQDKSLQALIGFAKKHRILLVNDNPYSLILSNKPTSLLKSNGLTENILELNSLSKTFNLSGWRIGALCGHEDLIKQVIKVKTNMDSGMFYPIQKGAIEALHLTDEWFEELNKIYQQRRHLIWKLCENLKMNYQKNTSGLFVWAKINSNSTSKEWSEKLLYQYNMFVTPGDVFGSEGEGYLRFSLCVSQTDIQECIDRTKTLIS